jgi:tetratricopeptide (TPR) repeat protein
MSTLPRSVPKRLQWFCLCAAVIVTNCAYINTFYNAQIAFNNAFSEHQKFLKGRTDSTLTVPDRVMANYERAIQKSIKTMDVYPKSKKWHDDAIFLMGKASFFKGEYDDAVRRMRRLQREFPESPFVPESYLYMGKAYLENENLTKADEVFKVILEKYSYLNGNEEITLLMAQVAIRREGKSQAVELLEKTLQSITAIDKKMEIYIQIAQLYVDLRRYEKAIATLQKAPRKKEFPQLSFRIELILLICMIETADYTAALTAVDGLLNTKAYLKYSGDLLLKKGEIYKRRGLADKAIAMFERITKDETGGKTVRGSAWYQMGLIYQHVKGDFSKAKECFQQAVSISPDIEIQREASDRMQAINRIAGLRDSVPGQPKEKTDTTRSAARTAYIIGESYWLSLQEPDSAIRYFARIAADTGAGNELIVKGLFAQAWILRNMKKDTVASDSIFHKIIRESPALLYVQKSQKELGLPVTVLTRRDSANIAFIKAEKAYFDEKDPVGACNSYLKVFKDYKDIADIAAKSIYAAAWLCDHAMTKKKVSAQKFYAMVCEYFPESDLCKNEAKPRLKVANDSMRVIQAREKDEQRKAKAAPAGRSVVVTDSVALDSRVKNVDSTQASVAAAFDSLTLQSDSSQSVIPAAQAPQPNEQGSAAASFRRAP